MAYGYGRHGDAEATEPLSAGHSERVPRRHAARPRRRSLGRAGPPRPRRWRRPLPFPRPGRPRSRSPTRGGGPNAESSHMSCASKAWKAHGARTSAGQTQPHVRDLPAASGSDFEQGNNHVAVRAWLSTTTCSLKARETSISRVQKNEPATISLPLREAHLLRPRVPRGDLQFFGAGDVVRHRAVSAGLERRGNGEDLGRRERDDLPLLSLACEPCAVQSVPRAREGVARARRGRGEAIPVQGRRGCRACLVCRRRRQRQPGASTQGRQEVRLVAAALRRGAWRRAWRGRGAAPGGACCRRARAHAPAGGLPRGHR